MVEEEARAVLPSLDEVILGMQYASLSITDDQPDTLKKIGKMNPWHIEALAMITGSETEPFLPLSTIMENHMNMKIDAFIDEKKINKGGHFIDTQGYIAHNDEAIVLAFRCTTSLYDWLTNFDTTSSEWEIDEDLELGFSGYCSSLEGLSCCQCIFGKSQFKPRVHTGCYNNLLACIPVMEKHVESLLGPDQPPRKLFVVGHSLGAGIANLAGMYFLFKYNWNTMPQRLITVTAGSPRVCQRAMHDKVETELAKYLPEKAAILRIVRNKDIVPTVPPSWLGFKHIGQLVYITEDDLLEMNAEVQAKVEPKTTLEERQKAQRDLVQSASRAVLEEEEDKPDADNSREAKYLRLVAKVPLNLRDHMPDFYMKPMKALRKALFPTHE